MNLSDTYERNDFIKFIGSFLPDFSEDERDFGVTNLKALKEVRYLGICDSLEVPVFEVIHSSTLNARVTLASDGFKILRDTGYFTALIVYLNSNSENWRLSLLNSSPEISEIGKIVTTHSNPRRFSYILGPDSLVNTPTKFLIQKGQIADLEELKSRFSLEVVNKEFYSKISESFTKLTGGTLKFKGKTRKYKPSIVYPEAATAENVALEYGVKLIGRLIFCWFLKEKKSKAGIPLMPPELLSTSGVRAYSDYFHSVIEPIFFEVLNKPIKSRNTKYGQDAFSKIPFLNGGLFFPSNEDYYQNKNARIDIPQEWFIEFFSHLEQYNFTIDENTSFDEELSIDPEMLGRIFENLLAEINPETGESARKSTGSYYTPRSIVDHMIDESLSLYLCQETKISLEKIKQVVAYKLLDNSEEIIEQAEQIAMVEALGKLKLLDPACGSGAFPIGALQKIVYVLQKIDPDGQKWFQKQIGKMPPELGKLIQKEFKYENFDYIRKLGVIRENIYGVDIQPIAAEISRLRCFLTLVVEQFVKDDLPDRNIQPLPNLDFKFVTANSLVDLPKSNQDLVDDNQPGLFDNWQIIDELRSIRDEYFSASGNEREDLKSDFVIAQQRLLKQILDERGVMGTEKIQLSKLLTTWKPFSVKSNKWFEPEWIFGIKNGFNIVISNPPWVFSRKGNFSEEEKEYYKKNYVGAGGKINLFGLFLFRGINLTAKNGIMTMIIPNTFLRGTTYEKLRRFLLERHSLLSIVDTGAGVFGNVTASTIVCFFMKTKPGKKINSLKFDNKKSIRHVGKIRIARVLNSTSAILNTNLTDKELEIQEKILNNSELLDEYADILISGIQTWKGKKNKFISNHKKSEEYKPLLEGKDIDRFFIKFNNKYIYYNKKVLNVMQDEKIFLENEKIVIQRVSGGNFPLKAAIDREQYYCFNSLNTLISKRIPNTFILAVLNSTVANWYYSTFFSNRSKLTVNISAKLLKQLPIPNINNIHLNEITQMVEKIMILSMDGQHYTDPDIKKEFQSQKKIIDNLIYEAYSFSDKEIGIIKNI
jgi:type I restriction-modification system DNA methylase subunit